MIVIAGSVCKIIIAKLLQSVGDSPNILDGTLIIFNDYYMNELMDANYRFLRIRVLSKHVLLPTLMVH